MARPKKYARGERSQAIRDYEKAHPEATANEIVQGLAEQGVQVNAAMVYNLRSLKKRKVGKKGRRKAAWNGAARGRGRPKASFSALSMDQIKATKELADQLGGVDVLRQSLDIVELFEQK